MLLRGKSFSTLHVILCVHWVFVHRVTVMVVRSWAKVWRLSRTQSLMQ